MMTPPLHYRSLGEVADDLRDGTLTSEEVTSHTLDRIAALEPRLHAFAEIRAEAALAEARAADARRRAGGPVGVLHGVPVAVKDLCAMAGTATRAGGLFPTGFAAGTTSTVVERLQAAGAIVVGKTQLTEGAWGSHHPTVPPPINPWSAAHWSGASSSGSGVSVAAGLAYGAIGTDTAGSIRFPSSCCHLVGLKPTWGRVSRYGVFPLSDTFDHVGPMARTVRDVARMFAAIAGPDALDPTTLDAAAADWSGAAQAGTLQGVRVGVDPAYAIDGIEAESAAAMRRTLDVLKDAGAIVVEIRMPEIAPHLQGAVAAAFAEAAVSHAATYPSERSAYSDTYAALLDIGRSLPATDYARTTIWRREFLGRLRAIFRTVDLIAAPVLPLPPPPADVMAATVGGSPLDGAPLVGFTIPFNLAGVPSLTLPIGLASSGVPLGFQLIGPELSEAALLSAGAGYEAASGFAARHPSI